MLKERTTIAGLIDTCNAIFSEIEDVEVLLELAKEESDKAAEQEAAQMLTDLEKKVKRFSLEITLDGEDDARDAIVSINAGAGGTDSQDWAEMLFRMYTRWIDKKGYKCQVIDFQEGDEAGIKGVTLHVSGLNCYGFMKAESGCTAWSGFPLLTPAENARPLLRRYLSIPKSRMKSISTLMKGICALMCTGPAGQADSMSTKPVQPCASPIFPLASWSSASRNLPSTGTGKLP